MHVESLSLSNFRNYRGTKLCLQPGLTLVAGENGQGKTNLLEAVFLLSGRNPVRFGGNAELVRWGQDSATVSGRVRLEGRKPEVKMNVGASGRRLEVNGTRVRSLSDSPLEASLFCPETLSLVKEGAQARRDLLDDLLERLTAGYSSLRSDYAKAMRQRNKLLQQGEGGTRLEPWDGQLVSLGAEIVVCRRDLARRMRPFVSEAYASLSGGTQPEAEARYESKLLAGDGSRGEVEAEFARRLAARRAEELARGLTLVGPHRDDVVLELDGRPLRGFGSQGEQRSAALALVLAEARVLEGATGEEPVLLLDDALSELDESRRRRLLEVLADRGQTIVTTSRAESLREAAEAHVVRIAGGEVIDG